MKRHPSPVTPAQGLPAAASAPGDQLGVELLATNPGVPASPPLPITVRLALGAIGVLLMCGATMAASLIITKAPPGRPLTEATQAAPIHGALALRPDLLRQARWPYAANGGFAQAASSAPSHVAPHPSAAKHGSPPPPASANPAAGSLETAIAVVHDFYRELSIDPGGALKLVSDDLLAGHGADVARAWEDATSVWPRHVDARPDGSVLTEVVAEYGDGSRVFLQQLLTVELGSAPKIVEAELLAARYLNGP